MTVDFTIYQTKQQSFNDRNQHSTLSIIYVLNVLSRRPAHDMLLMKTNLYMTTWIVLCQPNDINHIFLYHLLKLFFVVAFNE